MARREKIIIAIMVIAVIIGGYDLLIKPSSLSGPVIKKKSPTELTDFVNNVVGGIRGKDTKSDYIVSLASLAWSKDPFLQFDLAVESEKNKRTGPGSKQKTNFSYSGYLKMGGKSMAVINGVEYEEGENLNNGEYAIEKIFPASVVLKLSGGSNSITLFLDEAY